MWTRPDWKKVELFGRIIVVFLCIIADIRLDWQVFNMNKSDNQLLDMVVNFGDIFPLLDSQGNQLQPGKQQGQLNVKYKYNI